jgi:hypothetical protein
MYWVRRETVAASLPVLLLFGALGLVYLGVPPVLPVRTDPQPGVPLVSMSPGAATDVWSSVPSLLHLLIAALQSVLLVEVVRLIWIFCKEITVVRFLATLMYEASLVIDIFRRWGQDWFIWSLYQLRIGKLCPPSRACFPFSGAIPWLSLCMLGFVLLCLVRDLRERRNGRPSPCPASSPGATRTTASAIPDNETLSNPK